MGTGRRLAGLLLALGLIGAPAAALRIGCVGRSCRPTAVAAPAPFCSLPADLRALVSAGAYEGRSPDVLAVAGSTPVVSGETRALEVPWPSEATAQPPAMEVPLRFIGRGIVTGRLPNGVTLDQIAPTLEPLLGLHRAHPNVRSGRAIPGVVQQGATSPLVVLIVWKGVGMREFRNVTALPGGTSGDASGMASPGSLPLDPIAVEATIGTGGLPSQHGITGTEIRYQGTEIRYQGDVVASFGRHSPQPVIATLGDDLDLDTDGAARIGLIETATGDAALTGDAWYGSETVRDLTMRAGAHAAANVSTFLRQGWGSDRVPDLLAVAMSGSYADDDHDTDAIVDEILRSVPSATVVVAGTGSLSAANAVTPHVPEGVDTVAAGGMFMERAAASTVTAQDASDELRQQTSPDGSPLFQDVFASYAVRFGRYC